MAKSRREVWNELHELERQNDIVAAYMKVYRGHWMYPDDLDPEALVGLVEVLVDENKSQTRMLERFHEQHIDPPVVFRDKFPGDVGLQMEPGSIIVTSADERPKTERALVEHSEVVYFRDFLRSFWKRLTKRKPA